MKEDSIDTSLHSGDTLKTDETGINHRATLLTDGGDEAFDRTFEVSHRTDDVDNDDSGSFH